MDNNNEAVQVISFLFQNWQVIFLYSLKYLSDISKSIQDIKTTIKVHETHIEHFNNHLVEKH